MSASRDETSTMRTSPFISNDVHAGPARRWPLLAQSPSGHVGADTTPVRTPDQTEQVVEAEWRANLQAPVVVKADGNRRCRLWPRSNAIGRTTQRLDVVAAEVVRVPRVHRRLICGFPPDIRCSPDEFRLRSGISFRRQVSGVEERDIDVDDVSRIEVA